MQQAQRGALKLQGKDSCIWLGFFFGLIHAMFSYTLKWDKEEYKT